MANKKVSELPVVSTIDDNDIFVLDHNGSTGTATTSVLASYISGGSIPKPTGLDTINNGNVLTYQHSNTSWVASAPNFIPKPTTTSADNGKVLTYQHSTTSWIASASSSITSGTAVALTNQTSVDFTGIPNTAKRVVVVCYGMSTDGTVPPVLQVGSGSIVTSGYSGSISNFGTIVTTVKITTGFRMDADKDAAKSVWHGKWTLEHVGSNTWLCTGTFGRSNAQGTTYLNGAITLASNLDRCRISMNGTTFFDAGTANIMWE